MSAGGVPRDTTPKDQLPFIRRNATLLAELPEPGEHWTAEIIPDKLANQLIGLENKEIVTFVDRVTSSKWKKPRNLWKTDPDAYEQILDILEGEDRDGLLPCGHSAINNERGVDGISCGVCNEVHARDDIDRNRGEVA
ncbi:hypothetical protein [Natrinema pallidum]|uniref:Uncharacterized protein n=1 Tax=Natrinema pallidum TaxID=69527 RepID=A0A4V1IF33_9EURY|nr:hypothetical protein [Natrinema pallidum]QCW03594.1 hypothetical protein FGF80_10220 [Natrinema pallidum]